MAKTTDTPDPDVIPRRNDAYTGLLAISFLAMVGATVLLYLEYQNYEGKTPPKAPPIDVPGVQLKTIPGSGNAPPPPPPPMPMPMPMEENMNMNMMRAPAEPPAKLPASVTAAATGPTVPVGLIEIPELAETKPAQTAEKPMAVVPSKEPNISDAPPLPTTRFSPPE